MRVIEIQRARVWRMLEWMTVFSLYCATGKLSCVMVTGEDPLGPRLSEPRMAFEEATRLPKAGKYAEATAWGARALELGDAVLGDSRSGTALLRTRVS